MARAVQVRAAHETYGYGYLAPEFLDALRPLAAERHGWDIRSDWIVYTPGVNMALVCALEMYTQPGEGVIIQSPVYYPYYDYVNGTGRRLVLNPLVNREGYYEMDFAQLEELAADPRNKLMILCSPHNPVGRAWTWAELERVGRICLDHGVMLAVDEIHADLVLPPHRHIPFASLSPELAQHCIICTSPSKTFNLAGLLVSDIIIPSDGIRAAFRKKMAPYYLWPGNFGTAAQIAAYTEGGPWLDQLLNYLAGNAWYIADFLARVLPRVKYRVPRGHLSGLAGLPEPRADPGGAVGPGAPPGQSGPRQRGPLRPPGRGGRLPAAELRLPPRQLREALTRMADALGGL